MVKLRKNVEFYGSDEELTWKIPAVGKSVDELYEEKERKLYIDSVLKKHLSDLSYMNSTHRQKRQKFSVSLSLR